MSSAAMGKQVSGCYDGRMSRFLRDLIDTHLRTAADLEAFCVDHFAGVHQRFSGGMERMERVNLLFSVVTEEQVHAALGAWTHQVLPRVAKNEPVGLPASERGSRLLLAEEFDAKVSVHRPVLEGLALSRLAEVGVPLTLQAPEGFGKRWLLQKVLAEALRADEQQQRRSNVVRLNLRQDELRNAERVDVLFSALLRALLTQLAHENPEETLAQVEASLGDAKRRFLRGLEQHVLPMVTGRLVLVIENGDALYDRPTETDFFALLRSLAEDTAEGLQALRLVVTVRVEAGLLEATNHSSFFGLSVPLDVPAFTREDLTAVSEGYGLAQSGADLLQLHQLTNGHPHYCNVALQEASRRKQALGSLLQSVEVRGGPFAASLLQLRGYLDRHRLHAALQGVLTNPRHPLTNEQYIQLYRKSLVHEVTPGQYRLRCPLFLHYFRSLYNVS